MRPARSRVGHVHRFQQLLDGSVLAAASVQGDKRRVGPFGAQALHQFRADVNCRDRVPEAPQCALHTRAGAQRDAALQRSSTLEDRYSLTGAGARL